MSAGHALLAPSSAARWVKCPASALLEACYPDEETDAAREGTASHWVAAVGLNPAMMNVKTGTTAPNAVIVTDEMIEAATVYTDHVVSVLKRLGLDLDALVVEQRVDIPRVHAENWGTPDCWLYNRVGGHELHVWDYKFGHGYVDEYENWQLIDYTCGILSRLGLNGLSDQDLTVHMHIVQPRCYHAAGPVRSWSVLAPNLRAQFNILKMAADEAMSGKARAIPGAQCVNCNARHACNALQEDAYRSAHIARESLPVELSPAALGLELHFLRQAATRLQARITGLEQQAESLLRAGERVPYSALVPSNGRQAWSVPVAEVLALGELCGVRVAKDDVITPQQAIKAGIPVEMVNMYSSRSTSLKLAADDGRDAKRVFG